MMATKNVLVCEDDPVQLKVLSSLINLAGYRSLSAQTPGEAMIQARRCGIDAVVTDVVLPDGDGFDLVRDLRRLGFDAPVFMTSAHASEGMKEKARNAGVKAFFEKPLSLRTIRDRVDAVLRTSRMKDASVLLVESDAERRARLEKTIAEAGFAVSSVATGDEALEAISPRFGKTDLLLLTLSSPGASGAELIRKALAVRPSLKIVMMSDDAGTDDIRAGYEAGAAALVRKSISGERLQSFLTATFESLVVERNREEVDRQRSEQRAADPVARKTVRWAKGWMQAPSNSRTGRRMMGLVGLFAGLILGMGVAAGLQTSYNEADRLDAMMERVMAPTGRPAGRQVDAAGRLQSEAQLQLMREANDFTRRYYEGHLEELKRQAVLRNTPEPVPAVIEQKRK